MIKRLAHETLLRLIKGFPVIAITGPRQSGKTTLAKAVFADKPYLSVEDPDIRALAEEDPRGLLSAYPDGVVLDEVQRAPQLFSYLQTIVDAGAKPGAFILTGSQQFDLLSNITQSLAGRVGMIQLLPFSIPELQSSGKMPQNLFELMHKGFYPPIYDRDILPPDWFADYIATYVERDARQLVNIRNLSSFQRFVRMCAARIGHLLNLSALASDCGISHNTASSWLSILEASYIVYLLRPHHINFNKRLVKMPKLYFCDTGLAAWLLGIRNPGDIFFHAQRGALFENLIVMECLKRCWNAGLPSNLFFWRDSRGLEIDLLIEDGTRLIPVEIKSGMTIASDYLDNLKKWASLSANQGQPMWLVYAGEKGFSHGLIRIVPWDRIDEVGAESGKEDKKGNLRDG